MNKFKFKHENVEYEADLALLERQGLVKKVVPPITPITSMEGGNVYRCSDNDDVIYIQFIGNREYQMAFSMASLVTLTLTKPDEIIKYLNERQAILVGNIAKDVQNALDKFRK